MSRCLVYKTTKVHSLHLNSLLEDTGSRTSPGLERLSQQLSIVVNCYIINTVAKNLKTHCINIALS
jgi:hypothetical protein